MMLLANTVRPHVHFLDQPTPQQWRQALLHLRSRRPRTGIVRNRKFRHSKVEGHKGLADGQTGQIGNPKELRNMIDAMKTSLKSIGQGCTNISAYDTALVAIVKKLGGGDGPQFPLSIDWIVQNQLPDGSWGDGAFFLAQDRIINTIACVVALTSWNICTDKCKKGLLFIRENIWRLAEEEEDWMLVGFEITLPSLLDMAKELNINIPYDDSAMEKLYLKRNLKLDKIPTDVLHTIPTTLLYSIEGMVDLDWKTLLGFRCPDGSFHSSPAATAFALKQTSDKKCLEYLEGTITNFNGGAPCTYPMDVFECLWVVDRLMRLGISRHFITEIEKCLDYAYRCWTREGLGHTKHCLVKDLDDTAMGFRLLRLHGYHVNSCVFKHFEKDGEFFCFARETNKSITPKYNTYRASQLEFPDDDDILGRAKNYCLAFLKERQASNKLTDKWVIAKDLPGEVEYALDFPWKASLPRIETRMYLEQYGASSDVWIAKVLFRMPLICNDLYLETAKVDFRNFQRLCRVELHSLKRWYVTNGLRMYGDTPNNAVVTAYFLASANIFEPNRATERLVWARTAVLADAISSHFQRIGGAKHSANNLDKLIDLIAFDNANSDSLREAWKVWLMACTAMEGGEPCQGDTALLLVRVIEISSGRHGSTEDNLNLSEYSKLEQLTSSICRKLATRIRQNAESAENIYDLDQQVDLEMQELAQRVLQGCSGINRMTRQTFLHVVKSFCYVAHCSPETIESHIAKVIFQDVI